jgi:hypothetical protein
MSAVLFIDANQYLSIYGLVDGKKLLDLLERQKTCIFVSVQIVDEVLRNKLRCAREFFSDKFKEIKEIEGSVPNHLFGVSDQEIKQFRETLEEAKTTRRKLTEHAAEALHKISRSEDDVSKRLESLFDNALKPTDPEMKRARERKERGNPPGKPGNPLGDELTWEQLLANCQKEKINRVWIITSDKDYYTDFVGKHFLNSFLHQELKTAYGAAFEVRCFDNLMKGVKDFDKEAGANAAESLLTEPESTAIEKELYALSGMFNISSADAVMEAVLNRHRQAAAIATAVAADLRSSPPAAGIAPATATAVAADLGSSPPAAVTTKPPK